MEPLDRWLVVVCWLCNQSILVFHHYHDFERCPSQQSLGKPSKTKGNNVDSAGTSHEWTGKNETSREVKHDHSKKILSGMLCLLWNHIQKMKLFLVSPGFETLTMCIYIYIHILLLYVYTVYISVHKTSASTPGRTSAASVRFCTRWLERLAVQVSSLPCKNGPVRKRNLAHMFGTRKLDHHRRLFFATQIWYYIRKKKQVLALSPLANIGKSSFFPQGLPFYGHMGMGQYLLIPFLVGWTSIYQLFWGSLGTRVLTNPHISLSIHPTSQAQPDTLAHGSQLCLREHGGTPGDDTGEPGWAANWMQSHCHEKSAYSFGECLTLRANLVSTSLRISTKFHGRIGKFLYSPAIQQVGAPIFASASSCKQTNSAYHTRLLERLSKLGSESRLSPG